MFTFFHKSVRDYLLDEDIVDHEMPVSQQAGHSIYAEVLSGQISGYLGQGLSWQFPAPGSYCVTHLLTHLEGAGRGGEVDELLLRLPWLMQFLQERGVVELLGHLTKRCQVSMEHGLLSKAIVLSRDVLQVQLSRPLSLAHLFDDRKAVWLGPIDCHFI